MVNLENKLDAELIIIETMFKFIANFVKNGFIFLLSLKYAFNLDVSGA